MKKIILSLMLVLSLFLIACGKKEENLDMDLNEDLEKVYENVSDFPLEYMSNVDTAADHSELEAMLEGTGITVEEYLGNLVSSSTFTTAEYEQVIISEPFNTSIPHSVVLIKVKEGVDVEAVKAEILENADPRKWICVEADEVIVESIGDVVLLVMSTSEVAQAMQQNFLSLKK